MKVILSGTRLIFRDYKISQRVADFINIIGKDNIPAFKQHALSSMYNRLEKEGILDKIEYLFIPCLAQDASLALTNLASEDLEVIDGGEWTTIIDGGVIIRRDGNTPKFYLPKLANCNGQDLHWLNVPAKGFSEHYIIIGDNAANFFTPLNRESDEYLMPSYASYRSGLLKNNDINSSISYYNEPTFETSYITSWWDYLHVKSGNYLGGWICESSTMKSLSEGEINTLPTIIEDSGATKYLYYNNSDASLKPQSGFVECKNSAIISIGHVMPDEMLLKYQEIVGTFISIVNS